MTKTQPYMECAKIDWNVDQPRMAGLWESLLSRDSSVRDASPYSGTDSTVGAQRLEPAAGRTVPRWAGTCPGASRIHGAS